MASPFAWTLHRDGRRLPPGEVVAPEERLTWPLMIGFGAQHVAVMLGATCLVPLLTGFPPATTLFFSAIGTLLFLVITGGRVPSYLGSSFTLIAPITAATASHGSQVALGGVIAVGVLLVVIGIVVHLTGSTWIDVALPPVVTGTIVALIGFNLAPAAWNNFKAAPVTGLVTLGSMVLVTALFRGLLGRLSILVGLVVGYATAALRGEVDFAAVQDAAWFGLPQFQAPAFSPAVLGLFLPVVLVLVAENVGHVKSISTITGHELDDVTGRVLLADGVATILAGAGGGSGTTTYAENIGVMAATRVYSTAAYVVAAGLALGLSLIPKFGALIATIGVLGGAAVLLYGMIGIFGVRIWVQNNVDFADPVNLYTAAIGLVIGIANFTWTIGDVAFEGIALGSAATLIIYHVMRPVMRARGTSMEAAP